MPPKKTCLAEVLKDELEAQAGLCYLDDAALQAVSLEIYALCDFLVHAAASRACGNQRHQGWCCVKPEIQ